jgi:SAM-dependent methyltransferase
LRRYAVETARALARHPGAVITIGDALRPDPHFGIDRPWWNRRAISYLSGELRPGQRVVEWGSGGSTAWLVSLGARVTSVEHNPEWADRVRARGLDADIRTVPGATSGTVEESVHVGNTTGGRRFFDDYVAAIDGFADESIDVVIVDGMCRAECFRRARQKVRPGGLLVIDDSDTPAYRTVGKHVPGWGRTAFAGFKSSKDLQQTTFFRKQA